MAGALKYYFLSQTFITSHRFETYVCPGLNKTFLRPWLIYFSVYGSVATDLGKILNKLNILKYFFPIQNSLPGSSQVPGKLFFNPNKSLMGV
jgi:hypothetical protein